MSPLRPWRRASHRAVDPVRPVRGVVVNDIAERLAERRRRRRRHRFTAMVALGVALLVAAGGIYLLGFSPWLRVQQVTVSGVALLTPDQVRDQAAVALDQPLARVDTDAVAARVRTLTPVSEVAVVRSWPHTVTIRVTERTPVFAVQQRAAGGAREFLLVDSGGIAYTTTPTVPHGLLVAEVRDPALLDDLATVVTSLPPDLVADTSRVEAFSPDSIVLTITGRQVIWGSAERSELKAQVVVALMQREGKVYDVSAPDFPAVR